MKKSRMSPFLVTALLASSVLLADGANIAARAGCPSGWFSYKRVCYGYFTEKMSFYSAEAECQTYGHGVHLASIMNDAEANIITAKLRERGAFDSVWIGLYDPEERRKWQWIDGSMNIYTKWYSGEPNNLRSEEYCAQLFSPGGLAYWNDENCDHNFAFLCKYNP
uniref:C-type lectin domain-containing protein n=1 Tax=Latimeria chalumnae TaxID=7897 RepID=H3ADV2_LATCH